MNIKIVVAAHKQYQMPMDNIYVPLHVGAAGKDSIGYLRDDSGDNISAKNPYYCELTGLYWAWKNLEADYLGLVHYRRHFRGAKKRKDKFESVISGKELESILQKHSIIVPQTRKYYIESLYSHYAHTHYAEHLEIVKNIIERKYPEYRDSYDEVLHRTYGNMFNMMVMKRNYCSAYCTWLFDILEELETEVNTDELSDFQKRLYGRVSEILLNVWLEYQVKTGTLAKEEIAELPYIHMEKVNWIKKGTSFLKAKFLNSRYEKSF